MCIISNITSWFVATAMSIAMFWRKRRKYVVFIILPSIIYNVFSTYMLDYKEIYDKLEMLTKERNNYAE